LVYHPVEETQTVSQQNAEEEICISERKATSDWRKMHDGRVS
jgi:hypothetical protein